MYTQELSFAVDAGGTSAAVAISSTSAQSAAIASGMATICLTVAAFVRSGANPTALADGTDRYVPAGTLLRVNIPPGHKLAFKTSAASGTAYVTPEV